MNSVLISDAPVLAQQNLASAATGARKRLAAKAVSRCMVDKSKSAEQVVILAKAGIHLDLILQRDNRFPLSRE